MITINEQLAIPDEEIEWSYARSGGPGGQNVNKVSSKAVLRWHVANTTVPIPLAAWGRMKERFPSRFTAEGDVLLTSQEYRDQERNRQACVEKLVEMIAAALVAPTVRKKTKPGKGAKRRRLADKKQNSAKKQSRRTSGHDD
jgi:ribosome-associated protein